MRLHSMSMAPGNGESEPLESADSSMTPRAPDKSSRSSSSAIVLVECLVKVSLPLARLIRKSAEKEACGLSATDALLAAAGIQAHELASLRQAVERISAEIRQMSEQAALERDRYDQARTTIAQRDREIAVMRSDVRKGAEAVESAQRQIIYLKAQITEMEISLQSRDARLAQSLPLSGLDEGAAAVLRTLRNRLSGGEFHFSNQIVTDFENIIENLGRPKIRAPNTIRGARRIPLVRWLLRDRAGS